MLVFLLRLIVRVSIDVLFTILLGVTALVIRMRGFEQVVKDSKGVRWRQRRVGVPDPVSESRRQW